MQPFIKHTGVAVPLLKDDINTDQVAPVQAMRALKPDYKALLFMRAKQRDDGSEDPDFVLNKPQFRNPGILVTGNNFGAGSSREAAVWGMIANNIRVIVARSFADIYRENCLQNGLLPVVLAPADMEAFEKRVIETNGAAPFTVDLETQTISGPGGPRPQIRHPGLRPHALARRARRYRDDAQAHRRYQGVRAAHGGIAAVAADRDRQPFVLKIDPRKHHHERAQEIPSHHVRQEARADAGLLRRAVGARDRGGRLRGDRRRRLCRGRQPAWRSPTWASPTCATMPTTTAASAPR